MRNPLKVGGSLSTLVLGGLGAETELSTAYY